MCLSNQSCTCNDDLLRSYIARQIVISNARVIIHLLMYGPTSDEGWITGGGWLLCRCPPRVF
jgi:hypothetical protein